MERRHTIAGTPEVKVPIRVRGLSRAQRYFDERTLTTRLTLDFIVVRLRDEVDLDSELHVMNIRTQVGGTYRVAWINTRPKLNFYSVGLELLDPEGEIWEPDTIPGVVESGDAAPIALLECLRCHDRVSTPVPEAETSSLRKGFTIARHCDVCRATTIWVYCVDETIEAELVRQAETPHQQAPALAAQVSEPADPSKPKPAERSKDHRQKGRAPIQLAIKIIRSKYGQQLFDICETINVSRTGVYFATGQNYEPGEILEVIVPYHPDSVAIPVQARVVRRYEHPGTHQMRVAIQFTPGPTTER